jgi:peptidyl-prolyl cis-trans isomerase B (cyclophilin B)
MTDTANRRARALRRLAPLALLAGLGMAGCGKKDAPDGPRAADAAPADKPAARPDQPAATTSPAKHAASAVAGADDRLHQPFKKAVRAADNPPAEVLQPPDMTVSGKPVFKLLKQVEAAWDGIRFTRPDGSTISYTAVVETGEGTFEIALRPDLAPNHVRNFIALARAGYYDGLTFERARFEKGEEGPPLEEIEAGCPLGVGEPDKGHLGYWLNLEATDGQALHEDGAVGACRGYEDDSACCRFYVCLCKAPYLDGHYTVFGKVSRGLDVARTIYKKPVANEDRDRDGARRPLTPVVIKSVRIEER